MACVKIISVLILCRREDGKGTPVAKQRAVANWFCGSGHLPLAVPMGTVNFACLYSPQRTFVGSEKY